MIDFTARKMDDKDIQGNVTGASLPGGDTRLDFTPLLAMTVYMAFLAIMGLIGNVLVIVSVVMSHRLRSPSYALIVNLSVANLMVNFITIPLLAVSFFRYGWPYDTFWCHWVFYLIALSVGISIVTITLIAANRYILIVKSRRLHRRHCGPRALAVLISSMWISSVFVVALPELGFGIIQYDPLLRVCSVDNSDPAAFWYAAGLLIYGAFSGFILTPILYFLTFRAVNNSRRRIWAARNAGKRGRDDSNAKAPQRVLHPSEIRLTRLMAVIYVAIMVCWTLLSVLHFFKLRFAVPVALQRLALLLMLTNSSINPYLYAWLNSNFRRAFRKIVLCGQQHEGTSLNGAV